MANLITASQQTAPGVQNPTPITLDPDQAPQQPTISFDTTGYDYLLDPKTLDQRSFKAAFGLQGTAAERDQDSIKNDIASGNEQGARSDAATQLNIANQKVKINALSQMLGKNLNQPLTEENYQQLQNAPFSQTFSPDSVFEINYGNAYADALKLYAQTQDDTNPFNIVREFPTNDADAIRDYGSSAVATSEKIRSKLQNRAAQINSQGWGGYLTDAALNLSGVYNEVMERGNVPGVSRLDGLTLDKNLQAQAAKLYDLPFAQRMEAIDKIDASLDSNPQTAAAFWSAMLGQSGADAALNKVNTIGVVAGLPGAALSTVKVGKVVYNTASALNQVRKAFRDVAEANAVNTEMTKSKILASVGDIPNAAATEAADDLAKASTAPTEMALNTLDRYMKVSADNIEKDPGNLTTTQKNSIIEQYKTRASQIFQTLSDILRPTPIPGLDKATPEQLAAIGKSTFDRYPGMSNSILRLLDPILEPISNTLWQTAHIGRRAGEFFTSEDEAIQYARTHGLAVRYSEDQIKNVEARIADLQSEIKAGPSMHDDTAGLNRYYGLDKQLSDLQNQLKEAKASNVGSSVKKANKPLTDEEKIAKGKISTRIKELQDQLSDMDAMHDDTAGLNLRNNIEKELQSLKWEHAGVGQQGFGYYLEVTKPLNLTDRVIRDFIVNAERSASQTPSLIRNTFGSFVNKAMTAEDTFSMEHNAMRKAAVYPMAKLIAIAHLEAKNIKALTKGKFFGRKTEWNRFNEVLRYSQDFPSPKDGVPGHYFDTPNDLQKHYLDTYGELPTFKEQNAYFAVKRWSEYDLMLREIGLYRNKARLGAETNRLVLSRLGQEVRSAAFDGVSRKSMPGGSGNILLAGESVEASKIRKVSKMSQAEKQAINEDIQAGKLKLTEMYDPHQMPLKDMGLPEDSAVIHYVLSPAEKTTTAPLTWEQLPFRGGGHIVYDYSHYVKQAIVDNENVDSVLTRRYKGDRTVVPTAFRKQGQDFADKMNAVREALALGRVDEAKKIATNHLPFEWNELHTKFKDGTFNLHEPFQVVPKGLTISQVSKELQDRIKAGAQRFGKRNAEFADDTRNSLARNFQVEFTGERDAEGFRSIEAAGTRANPVFNWRPAEKIDPIKIMNRSLGSITRSTFMDDYKTYAVESWLQEALTHMKEDKSVIQNSPFFSFKTATRDSFLAGTPRETVDRLLANKFKIDQLIGIPTEWDGVLHNISQKLLDATYGKPLVGTSTQLIAPWLLAKTRDPFAFIRGVTFDAYLGVFAPWQIFVQMASYVNFFGITPRFATAGSFAALLHMYGSINRSPEILEHLDGLATKMNAFGVKWKPGEFKEAFETLPKTGFSQVGGEYGPLNNIKYAQPIKSGTDTFLQWGRKPFQMGESSVRVGAWYIAFKEFRDANPLGAVTKADLQNILNRADLLYGNMSTASSSILHTGILSLPMQFYQYTIRLAELFWSKRLGETLAERTLARARLLAVNGAMFGTPLAFGMTGVPVADYLRQQQLEDADNLSVFNPIKYARYLTGTGAAYNVNKASVSGSAGDWIEHFFMEGLPSTMVAMATGKYGDHSVNTDFGPRYGTQGLQQVGNIASGILNGLTGNLQQDQSMWKIISGAPGELLSNVLGKDLIPMVMVGKAILTGDAESFPMTTNDWVDAVRSIQTVNKFWGLQAALRTGKWINRNDDFVTKVGPIEASLMTVFGLSPQEQKDVFNIQQNAAAYQSQVKSAQKFFQTEMNRAVIAQDNNDFTEATLHFTKAMFYLKAYNINEDDATKMMSDRAYGANEPLVSRVNWNRYIQHAPDALKERYLKVFQDVQQSQEKR